MGNMEARARPFEILLVEDNPADVVLTEEALKEIASPNRMSVSGDGPEALAVLRRQGRHAGAARPDLILLDLDLPGKSGLRVLQEIKTDPDLKQIPVVVFTSSTARAVIARSYELGANCYIAKPASLDGFVEVVKAIEDFWLRFVRLPTD